MGTSLAIRATLEKRGVNKEVVNKEVVIKAASLAIHPPLEKRGMDKEELVRCFITHSSSPRLCGLQPNPTTRLFDCNKRFTLA